LKKQTIAMPTTERAGHRLSVDYDKSRPSRRAFIARSSAGVFARNDEATKEGGAFEKRQSRASRNSLHILWKQSHISR